MESVSVNMHQSATISLTLFIAVSVYIAEPQCFLTPLPPVVNFNWIEYSFNILVIQVPVQKGVIFVCLRGCDSCGPRHCAFCPSVPFSCFGSNIHSDSRMNWFDSGVQNVTPASKTWSNDTFFPKGQRSTSLWHHHHHNTEFWPYLVSHTDCM